MAQQKKSKEIYRLGEVLSLYEENHFLKHACITLYILHSNVNDYIVSILPSLGMMGSKLGGL